MINIRKGMLADGLSNVMPSSGPTTVEDAERPSQRSPFLDDLTYVGNGRDSC
jgi:hypothetical protein